MCLAALSAGRVSAGGLAENLGKHGCRLERVDARRETEPRVGRHTDGGLAFVSSGPSWGVCRLGPCSVFGR